MNKVFLSILNLYEIIDSKFRKKFYFLTILMVLSAIFEIISLGSIIPFVSSLLNPDFFNQNIIGIKIKNFYPTLSDKNLILLVLIFFSIIVIISGLFKTLLLWLTTNFNAEIGIDLSNKIYNKVLNIPYDNFVIQKSNRIISDVANKITTVIFFVIFPMLLFLTSFIQIVAIVIFLMSIDILLIFLILLLLLIFYFSTFTLVRGKLLKNSKSIANQEISLVKQIQESFGGKKEIMINNLQDFYLNNFKVSNKDLRNSQASNAFLNILPKYIIETIAIVLISFIIFQLVFNESSNEVNTDFLALIALLGFSAQKLMPLIQQVYASTARVVGSYDSLVSVDKILKLKSELKSLKRTKISHLEFQKFIYLKKVFFSYQKNNRAYDLSNINIKIIKGQKIGIAGKTGSGKSTLVDIISGVLNPNKGKIKIDKNYLNSSNLKSWQKNISIVPQNIFLNDDTILNNIAYSINKKEIDYKLINYSIKISDLKKLINSKKNKIHSKVGERGISLSGGQRQKIAIARAFYKKAKLIIFDEATSALDLETERNLIQTLKKLPRDITLIMISHRIETLKFCDKIVEMENGRVKNYNSYKKLVAKSKTFRDLIYKKNEKD